MTKSMKKSAKEYTWSILERYRKCQRRGVMGLDEERIFEEGNIKYNYSSAGPGLVYQKYVKECLWRKH